MELSEEIKALCLWLVGEDVIERSSGIVSLEPDCWECILCHATVDVVYFYAKSDDQPLWPALPIRSTQPCDLHWFPHKEECPTARARRILAVLEQ